MLHVGPEGSIVISQDITDQLATSVTAGSPPPDVTAAPADRTSPGPTDGPEIGADQGTSSAADDGIAHEQRYVGVLYERLDDLWAETKDSLRRALRETDGTPQGLTNRDVAAARYSDRLQQLGSAEYGLCFGRLDLDPARPPAPHLDGEQDGRGADPDRLYIGRMGLYDQDFETLLIDWRAPAARPFYLATAVAPAGVTRRRHLRTRRRRVVSIDDESLVYVPGTAAAPTSLTGESALLAALGAARTGRMGDIVETIQAEQDRIIRSEVNGALVVQGGPGTGKTAVALHRAAYLLYTHRERLATRGVLVVGPNSTFLRYIEQVLPALGETAVSLATVGTLYPGIRATVTDGAAVAVIKGAPSMAATVAAAVADRQQLPDRGDSVRFERYQLTLDRGQVTQARRRARSSRQPHNKARSIFFSEMLTVLAHRYADQVGENVAGGGNLLDRHDLDDVRDELRADGRIQAALNTLWPRLTPEALLRDLFASDDAMARIDLTSEQRRLLRRERSAPWSVEDVPLLDEAAELLGVDDRAGQARARRRRDEEVEYAQGVLDVIEGSRSADFEDDAEEEMLVASDLISADVLADRQEELSRLTTAERASLDREWTYGHLIVDEAQELSPMAWRTLMRRCPTRSMTIVGDVAQTSDPAGTSSWQQVLTPYLGERWRLAELTVNYRTPAEIMVVANEVLAAIDPDRRPPESVRETGERPIVTAVATDGVVAAIVAAAERESERQVADRDGTVDSADTAPGTTAIVVADDALAALTAAVTAYRPGLLEEDVSDDPDLRRPLVMLTTRQAKGLEFDAVILVEPAAIAAESGRGLNDLYVALTRPTKRLTVLHSTPLPDVLRSGLENTGSADTEPKNTEPM
ncbi:MAG: AAA family ATPase [Nakamurella sp.]